MPIPDRLFEPNRSFFSLAIVQLTFAVVTACAGIASFAIMASTNLAFDFTADGFSEFLSIFRFPLGVMALLIPIMALYATNHRSVQQKQQIQLAGEQNNFVNYYKHLEEFQKHYSEFWMDFYILVMRPGLTPKNYHRLFYRDSRVGNYQIEKAFYEKQLDCLFAIIDELRLIDSVDDPRERYNHFVRAENKIKNFCSNMYFNYFGRIVVLGNGEISSHSEHYGSEAIKKTISALQEGIHFFIYLAQFAHEPIYSRQFPIMTLIDANSVFDDACLGHNELTGKFGFSDAYQKFDKIYKHHF